MSMRQRSNRKAWVGLVVTGSAMVVAAGCIPGVGSGSGPFISDPQPPQGGSGVGRFGPPPVFESPRSAERPPVPLSGGTLAVLSDGKTAIASDPDRDSIFVVDYSRLKLLAKLPLQPFDEPGRIAEDGAGRVHVALRRGGALVTLESKVTTEPGAGTSAPGIQTTTWSIVARRAICAAPRGVAYDRARDTVHVACAEGELVSLAPAPDGAVTRRLKMDRDVRDVVVDGDNILVSHFRTAEVVTLNLDGKVVARFTPPVRQSQSFSKRPPQQTSSSQPSGPPQPTTIDMAPSVAWRMVPSGSGETMLVHQRSLVDEVSTQPGGYGSGAGCGGGIVETAVTNVGVLGSPKPTPPVTFAVLPIDMAVSPDRRTFAIIAAGNARQQNGPGAQLEVVQAAQVINAPDNGCVVGTRDPFQGMNPFGADAGAAPPPGEVLSPTPGAPRQPVGEAVAVAYDRVGHLLVQTRQPATVQIVTSDRAAVVLAVDDLTDTGHGVFHANSGSSLACASCHPEGGDDGRVWKFFSKDGKTVEPRRTQNLHGGILATAPFHWAGDLKDVDTLMDEVFVNRMGGPKLDRPYLDILKGWMDTMRPLPSTTAAEASAVDRGRSLFSDPTVGCATCHAGGLLTNNTTVDVGTGGKFQVPSLRGIGWRAPFMHDGCAKTLRDRFANPACSGGDKHGVTSRLSGAQVDDLIAYLETL